MGIEASWGFTVGTLPHGPRNLISDVPGVTVGHCTLADGGVQTGVTALLPHQGDTFHEKVPAAAHVINGFGKTAGLVQIEEHLCRVYAERLVPVRIRVVPSEYQLVPGFVRWHSPLIVVSECELPVRHIAPYVFVLPVGDGTYRSEMMKVVGGEGIVVFVSFACVSAHQGFSLHVFRRSDPCEAED